MYVCMYEIGVAPSATACAGLPEGPADTHNSKFHSYLIRVHRLACHSLDAG